VIDGHHCFISDRRIEHEFDVVRAWVQASGLSYFDRKKHVGLLRYALVRCTSVGEVMLVIVTSIPKDEQEERALRSAFDTLRSQTRATSLLWGRNSSIKDVSQSETIEAVFGNEYIVERIADCEYEISPNAFFQTNSQMAEVLLQRVLAACSCSQANSVVDLFCGSGFFSLALAKQGLCVYGVEMVEEAIVAARRNATRNNVAVDFHAALAERFDWTSAGCDLLVLDPPRSGLHPKLLAQVCEVAPQHIVYVSCNFEALAREFPSFDEKYELRSCEAIDMFPHTPHVELVTHLQRRK
jgi:23S rRNA (uracil1939-C5)-methyltransferase